MRHTIARVRRWWDRRKAPKAMTIMPEQFLLMFSGQSADSKYYPEKNGVGKSLRRWR